jgi:hypothetical protein
VRPKGSPVATGFFVAHPENAIINDAGIITSRHFLNIFSIYKL